MGDLVGYRFQPKDEEIISVLHKKRLDPDFPVQTIPEVDIYNFEPSELPGLSAIQSNDLVWYFFCAPYYKFSKSKRANRRTRTGYWKVTGQGCKIIDKNNKHVIGKKKFLVFCEHSSASKKHKTEWAMHEFQCEHDHLHKKDFVICRIERKTNKKPKISTRDDGQSSHHLASSILNHIEENNFSMVESQQLPTNDHMTSNLRNHVAENTYLRVESQQLLSHMPFDFRNHVAENNTQREESKLPPNHNLASNSGNQVAENNTKVEKSQRLPSHNLAFDYKNHVAENMSFGEGYQLFSHFLTSDERNHVAENNLPMEESQLLPSHYLASHFTNHVIENASPWLDYIPFSAPLSPIDREHQVLSDCNWLDQIYFSERQSPTTLEHRSFPRRIYK